MFLRSFNQIKTGKLTLSSTAQKLALKSTLENSRMDDIPVREVDEFYLQGVATHIIKKIASSIDRLR